MFYIYLLERFIEYQDFILVVDKSQNNYNVKLSDTIYHDISHFDLKA